MPYYFLFITTEQSCSVFYGPDKFSPLKLGVCEVGSSSCKCTQGKVELQQLLLLWCKRALAYSVFQLRKNYKNFTIVNHLQCERYRRDKKFINARAGIEKQVASALIG